MRFALLLLVPLAGCAQILGLDETQGPGSDGGDDTLPACDEELTCGTGEVCGRIYDWATGDSMEAAGEPALCAAGETTSPCNLQLSFKGYPDLGGSAINTTITRDTCARFTVSEAPLGAQVYGVEVEGSSFISAVTLVTGEDVARGDNVEVRVAAIRNNYYTTIGLPGSPPTQPWFVITHSPAGIPQMANVIKRDGTTLQAGSAVLYFQDQDRLTHQMVNGSQSSTGTNGTAVIPVGSGELSTGCDRALVSQLSFPSVAVVYRMYCDI